MFDFLPEEKRLVNREFTKFAYAMRMLGSLGKSMRAAALAFCVAVLALILSPSSAWAQNADIDWADAGAPSQGTLPSGTVVTGSDGTTATVSRTITDIAPGTFTEAFFADDFLSYFSGQIGDGTSLILLNFNNSQFDPNDRVTVDIVLSRAVTNLNFSLSDVDSGGNTDAIEVFYDDDLTGGFTNAAGNTALWSIGPSVTRTNDSVVNGWRGTAASDQFGTDGDIDFDFGATEVRRIRVVYFSYTGSGNPGSQFVGLSDFTYTAPGADLSLTKSLIGSPPVQNGTAVWRLTVTNDAQSTQGATGIVVRDTLPGSFSFDSASGDGSFNSANGNWTVPDLNPGQSASITLTGTISASSGSTVTNTAEIIAMNEVDPDSTVNNGATGEDDFASASFTVQSGNPPGIPPILSCPAGFSVFDWDTIPGWTNGSESNTYAFLGFGDISFDLTNDGTYINNAALGGLSPNVGDVFAGGLSPAEDTLTIVSNQPDRSGEVEITITLPRAFTGLQFAIFDVDLGTNQFVDRVEVVGSNGGTSVLPTLTNGNVNTVNGNVAVGTSASGSAEALGNVVVTFTQAVDTVTIRYGNTNDAPFDPGQQGIGLHDITVCNPFTTLNVSKVSSIIADPVNGAGANAKAIPGATVEYLITVTNTGSEPADTDSVLVWDDGPADAKMCLITRSGGPVLFADPGGNSNLSYDYGGTGSVTGDLAVTTDDLEFSRNEGASFDYTPSADGEGCDTAITDFRVRPSGAFAGGGSFTITVRFRIE